LKNRAILDEEGKSPRRIRLLLEDSRRWAELRTLLRLHISKSRELHDHFENNVAFFHEVREFEGRNIQAKQSMPTPQPVKPEESPDTLALEQGLETSAIVELARQIDSMQKGCNDRITELEKRTNHMIGLVGAPGSRLSPWLMIS
jgi:hypothetical protein